MKLKLFVVTTLLLLLFYGIVLSVMRKSPPLINERVDGLTEQSRPLKTFFFIVLPGSSKQILNLDIAATRLVITTGMEHTAIHCGHGTNTYICMPGNPQEMTSNTLTPITQLWAKNPYKQQVELQIDVYEVSKESP